MGLSANLVNDYVKLINEPIKNEAPKETTVYATTVEYDGKKYVRIDGSDLLTPVETTVNTNDGDRVTVMLKDHTATVTGNITDPSASSKTVVKIDDAVTNIDVSISHKITTENLQAVNAALSTLTAVTAKLKDASIINAEIESLESIFINTDHLNAKDIEAITAKIESIEAKFGEFSDLSTEDLEAVNAEITNLKGYAADFTYVSTDVLKAMKGAIDELEVEKLDVTWANINIAEIDKARIDDLFVQSGIIEKLISDSGTFTKELIGVTIKGDLIEAGTIKVDRLVVKGSDGNYYALNTDFEGLGVAPVEEDAIHGSVMVANSITAEKIAVSDLTAFGATIAGFKMEGDDEETGKVAAIYSLLKETIDSPVAGIYLDRTGQVAFGDDTEYFKFYKNENGVYKMSIAAETITFGGNDRQFKLGNDGMTVEGVSDESNNTVKTNISNNGMKVYGNEKEVLAASDQGVVAKDLHAETYLIVGKNSRFENYGENRTGCFWIGG